MTLDQIDQARTAKEKEVVLLKSDRAWKRLLLESEKAKLFLKLKAEAEAAGKPISDARAEAEVKAELTGKLKTLWQASIEASALCEGALMSVKQLERQYWDTKP